MNQSITQQINWNFKTNGFLEIYDKNDNLVYREISSGVWLKCEYDSKGNVIYVEDSDGYWEKCEYDSQGNEIYFENSRGAIIDHRPKPCEDKVVEIDGEKFKLVKV